MYVYECGHNVYLSEYLFIILIIMFSFEEFLFIFCSNPFNDDVVLRHHRLSFFLPQAELILRRR